MDEPSPPISTLRISHSHAHPFCLNYSISAPEMSGESVCVDMCLSLIDFPAWARTSAAISHISSHIVTWIQSISIRQCHSRSQVSCVCDLLHRKQDLWKLCPSHWTSSAKYTVFLQQPHLFPPPSGILTALKDIKTSTNASQMHIRPYCICIRTIIFVISVVDFMCFQFQFSSLLGKLWHDKGSFVIAIVFK